MTTRTADELNRRVDHWRAQWNLKPGLTYLNHGAFGLPPRVVTTERKKWLDELTSDPVHFFVRRFEGALDDARKKLAAWVGAGDDDLAFFENTTAGMNVVAASVPLAETDEVLLGNQEYGAVRRIWQRACDRSGARLIVQDLPERPESQQHVADTLMSAASDRTRLIVVSHVTSPTATVQPVELICREARRRGMTTCIDGAHALVMRQLALKDLDCDFYIGSCHKWLSASSGSGFLYVHPRTQSQVQPPVLSWGRLPELRGDRPDSWRDEFTWLGTRDPTPHLTVPAALDFLDTAGLEYFRAQTHAMAQYARETTRYVTGVDSWLPDTMDWYGSMIAMPLPEIDPQALGRGLWEQFGIEVPIVTWNNRRLVRASCHLYTSTDDIDRLAAGLRKLLP